MSKESRINTAINEGSIRAHGHKDSDNSLITSENRPTNSQIKVGIVEQFNVGLYSVVVSSGVNRYTCYIGACNITPGFGFSDANILREGDEVIFSLIPGNSLSGHDYPAGMVLARKPSSYSIDINHTPTVRSKTNLARRTSFFSSDCLREDTSTYTIPLEDPYDLSTKNFLNNRPTDFIPGDFGTLNQHHCGVFGSMYSTTISGGRAQIRFFALENRIRIIADSIIKYTLTGNENEWHNRRYLSNEKSSCLYQEERLGLHQKEEIAFDPADYKKEGYFTKNKVKRQTAINRTLEQEGYYGGLSSRYCLRPDPDLASRPRSMTDYPNDPGVYRESIDPSGQYRLASSGMIGIERIGRIPVPFRKLYPWQVEAKEPKAETLSEFKHSERNPFYRQLELADRVAYDLKNSYSRVDNTEEFHTPQESDLAGKLTDIYDTGFTNSKTVKLQKFDKRRSGIWQGEDGSIIIRDAWGSEIVMIGGNIQLSCAGNVEILPGRTALTLAGDDIVHKAQNSIDIYAAKKDVRVDAYRNVQIMAGIDDDHPGGITLEAAGESYPWDADTPKGGEDIASNGITLKTPSGNIITDAKNTVIRSKKYTGIIGGDEEVPEDSVVAISASQVVSYATKTNMMHTANSALFLNTTAALVGDSAILAGSSGVSVCDGSEVFIPLDYADAESDVAKEALSIFEGMKDFMTNESKVGFNYTRERLEKMYFKFRNSDQCRTMSSWEIGGTSNFTLYEPFWVQVKSKFETLKGSVSVEVFDDNIDLWGDKRNAPWPGLEAKSSAKYAMLANISPANMDYDGLNKSREEVTDRAPVSEPSLIDSYLIRK